MKSTVRVTGIEVTSLAVKVPKIVEHLLPTTLTQQKCQFTVSGVSNAHANALRRTLGGELACTALHCEYEDIVTDDPHIIPEMIQKRINMIPLLQSAPSRVYELTFANTTLIPQDVKTALIVSNGVQAPINSTYTLLTLAPGKKITIKNIRHRIGYGYTESEGMFTLAYHCTSIAKDIEPLNAYEETGVSSHNADPREWELSFCTNGTIDPKLLVKLACENLIERMQNILGMMGKIRADGTKYTLDIPGESDTIGNLFTKSATELFPGLMYFVHDVPVTERKVTLRINYDEDIDTLFTTIVERDVGVFKQIATAFEE